MKTTLRKIVVQNQEFRWSVGEGTPTSHFPDDHVLIRIWIANQKSKPWAEIKYLFNNRWHYYGELISDAGDQADLQKIFQFQPVTPGLVAKMIESLLLQFGASEKMISTQYFEYTNETLQQVNSVV